MCRRQDSGKYVVELMKEGQSRVQVKKRRSECLPELLGTDRGLPGFLDTSDEDWRLTEREDRFVLKGFMGELVARGQHSSKLV